MSNRCEWQPEQVSPAEPRERMSVGHAQGRHSPERAAQIMVQMYGRGALDHDITAKRAAFDAYWTEVDRLLAQQA